MPVWKTGASGLLITVMVINCLYVLLESLLCATQKQLEVSALYSDTIPKEMR